MAPATLPPEIWTLVGQKISSKAQLASLARVSSAFRDIFTPLLNEHYKVLLEPFAYSGLREHHFSMPQFQQILECIRHFDVDIRSSDNPEEDEDIGIHTEHFAFIITEHILAMKHLRSFSWLDTSFLDSHEFALTLRVPSLLEALKDSTTLEELTIHFSSRPFYYEMESDLIAPRKCFFPLKGFRSLSSLELYSFFGEETEMIEDIAHVLSESPCLKKLGLGLANLSGFQHTFRSYGGKMDFWRSLCEVYGKTEKPPLKLRTLRLGWGMVLSEDPQKDKTGNGHYVTQLLDVKSLQNLHIWNGEAKLGLHDETGLYPFVDLTPFKDCPLLKQLSLSRLDKNIVSWLCGSGSSIYELILTKSFDLKDEEFGLLRGIPNHITMAPYSRILL